MKLNEVIAKYGNADVDESKIKEVLGVKKSTVWEPSYDEYYFYYTSSEIYCTRYSTYVDQQLFSIGNCFKTKEEAEFARDKQIFLTKFERYLRDNEDEPVDWENQKQNKYYIMFIHNYKRISIDVWSLLQGQGSIFTTSEDVLEQFIKDNESDIKKYMFGVE